MTVTVTVTVTASMTAELWLLLSGIPSSEYREQTDLRHVTKSYTAERKTELRHSLTQANLSGWCILQ